MRFWQSFCLEIKSSLLILAEFLLGNTFNITSGKDNLKVWKKKNAEVCWWSLQRNFIVVERVSLAICDQSGMAWSDNENRSWHPWVVKSFLTSFFANSFQRFNWVFTKCSRKVLIKSILLIKSNFQTPSVFLSVVSMHGFQVKFWLNRAS